MNLQILNPLRWRKSFLFWVLAGFVIVWFTFIDTYSLWTRFTLYQQKVELDRQTEELRAETDELRKKVKDLKSNPELLERIAREEYGMKKEGETIYKVNVKK